MDVLEAEFCFWKPMEESCCSSSAGEEERVEQRFVMLQRRFVFVCDV